VWLPTWLPRRTRAGALVVVFKSIGDSLPDSVATWAFSGRARRGTQDHPAYIPRAVRCPVRYTAAEHLFRREIRTYPLPAHTHVDLARCCSLMRNEWQR
jgi:hypothetical protein